jgi:hypothetical protein
MSIFQAQPGKERQEKLRERLLWTVIVVLLVGGMGAYFLRHWPQERVVDRFFTQIEAGDYRAAYATWRADPEWEKNVDKYKNYPFGQFQLDWGPTSEYGKITAHKIEGSVEPRSTIGEATGVVVAVRVNNLASKPACIWVDKRTKALSFSPIACAF